MIKTVLNSSLIIFVLSHLVLITSCSKIEHDLKVLDLIQEEDSALIKNSLQIAGNNSDQLIDALNTCPKSQLEGLVFLIKNMPERDLKNLSTEFLLENVDLAYSVMDSVNWGNEIPSEIFQNFVLPYVSLHERRDAWRPDFIKRFLPLIRDIKTTSEATLKLNNEIWEIINVHYSTKRPKADQSPYESIDAGLASCTGLSIILIDACRSVGIPARFVGIPLWKDQSGNHSWVEIWDNGWHYIGAAEKSPLNKTWFGERAALSDDTNWKYSIYSSSYKKTDVIFPPLFDSTATYVYADIITDRYSKQLEEDGLIALGIRLFNHEGGNRIVGKIELLENGKVIANGETRNEKHDYNDFLVFSVRPMAEFNIHANSEGNNVSKVVSTDSSTYQFVELYLNDSQN